MVETVTLRRRIRPVAWWLRPRTRKAFSDLAADRASARALRRLSNPLAKAAGDPETVQLKALPHPVYLRPGTTDAGVAFMILRGKDHLPPEGQRPIDPKAIWDLGANNGITTADMAVTYPDAKIVSVELDPGNAEMARRNTSAFGGCEVIAAAVWPTDGQVSFNSEPGHENASHVSDRGAPVEAVSLNTLAQRYGPADYVKMDIEGAEQRVLAENTEWAEAVECIAVECHGDYRPDDCAADLRRLGFAVEINRRSHMRPVVVGHRSLADPARVAGT